MSKSKQGGSGRAVALQYGPGSGAPVIVASGMGHLAERIVEVAVDSGVPVYEDNSLATILSQMELGREIPEELYQAIVDIYIYFCSSTRRTRRNTAGSAGNGWRRSRQRSEYAMSYKYMLLDSRGAPVAQGVSEDGPEKTFGSSGSPTGISSGCWGMSTSAWWEPRSSSRRWKGGLSGAGIISSR